MLMAMVDRNNHQPRTGNSTFLCELVIYGRVCQSADFMWDDYNQESSAQKYISLHNSLGLAPQEAAQWTFLWKLLNRMTACGTDQKTATW